MQNQLVLTSFKIFVVTATSKTVSSNWLKENRVVQIFNAAGQQS